MNRFFPSTLVIGFLFVAITLTRSSSGQSLSQLVDDYLAKRPTQALQKGLKVSEALAAQQKFVEQLIPKLGPQVGYKVGLVTKQTQERYGATGPMRGVLLRDMMFKDGSAKPWPAPKRKSSWDIRSTRCSG